MTRAKIIEVQGHRGARGLWPENTIIGFLKAIELGVDVLEMDVVMTGDSQILVSHDPYFDPTFCFDTNNVGIKKGNEFNIFEMNFREIVEFDCGIKSHPSFPEQASIKTHKPLLKDVLRECLEKKSSIRFNIEIKSKQEWLGLYQPKSIDHYVDLIVSELNSLEYSQFNLQSFDQEVLKSIAMRYPKIRLSYLIENQKLYRKIVNDLGIKISTISPEYILLNETLVKHYQEQSLKVIPWTVNEKKDMLKLIDWGVDGIITDYPNRLFEVLKSH